MHDDKALYTTAAVEHKDIILLLTVAYNVFCSNIFYITYSEIVYYDYLWVVFKNYPLGVKTLRAVGTTCTPGSVGHGFEGSGWGLAR